MRIKKRVTFFKKKQLENIGLLFVASINVVFILWQKDRNEMLAERLKETQQGLMNCEESEIITRNFQEILRKEIGELEYSIENISSSQARR